MSNAALKYDVTVRHGHGRWALLFSHPDDFASYGFESDRWLVHVQEAFAATGIRPFALAGHDAGWVTHVGGSASSLALDQIQRYPVARDSREEALRAAAFDPAARFVMTLDSALRLRRTFVYTQRDRLPSPMDLAVIAKGVRDTASPRLGANRAIARNTPAIPFPR